MSINTLLHGTAATDSQSWKKIGVNTLYVKNLEVDGNPLSFDSVDTTLQVSTYDSSNVLVTANVTTVTVLLTRVANLVFLTVPSFTYTSPGVFSYFGFTLPTGFRPTSTDAGLLLCSITGTFGVTKYNVLSTGQVRIFKDIAAANFANGNVFLTAQQTLTIDTDN